MADTDTTDSDARISPLIPMTTRELVSTTIAGAVAGASIAVLYLLMHHFVFQAVLCRAQAMSGCSEAPSYAMTVAMMLGGAANLVSAAGADASGQHRTAHPAADRQCKAKGRDLIWPRKSPVIPAKCVSKP